MKERVKEKPRTYRVIVRKEYFKVAKQRRLSRNQKRKAIKKQLNFILKTKCFR